MTDVLPVSTTSPHAHAVARTRTQVVLDTSVLIADPEAISGFPGTDVVIPLTVVEELDGLKSRPGEVGFMARSALRSLEAARMAAGGTLTGGTPIGKDSTVRVELNGVQRHLLLEHGLDIDKADNRIIGAALGLTGDVPVIVMSNDAAFRLKAAHMGLVAREHLSIKGSSVGPGWVQLDVAPDLVDMVYQAKALTRADFPDEVAAALPAGNAFAVLRSGSASAMVRLRSTSVELMAPGSNPVWGLKPRNKEQRFALELLLDPAVPVVALDGPAGCGKSLLAYAAGLELTVERGDFERLSVFKPLVAVGREEVGFLPGDLGEKIKPYFAAFYDSVTTLTERKSAQVAETLVQTLLDSGKLSMEPVTFLRGRSISSSYLVIDEASNLERSVLKTLLTRVSEGTKIVFTGDESQIDHPFASPSNNALTALIDAFDGTDLFGHVRLTTCERSPVAELAAELL
jgi:PhoH-like ATPase